MNKRNGKRSTSPGGTAALPQPLTENDLFDMEEEFRDTEAFGK